MIYRWNWQLIKNAKDAPNKFNKIKIKQELLDKKFLSMHNADPFTITQLHNLISQYSKKLQKNKNNFQTSGQYENGFINTQFLSKKVHLECCIKYQNKKN